MRRRPWLPSEQPAQGTCPQATCTHLTVGVTRACARAGTRSRFGPPPPTRNSAGSSPCPQGKVVWARVYPSPERYPNPPVIRNHSADAGDHSAARLVPVSAAEARQTGSVVCYRVFFVGFSPTAKHSPCPPRLYSARCFHCCPTRLQDRELTPFIPGSASSLQALASHRGWEANPPP